MADKGRLLGQGNTAEVFEWADSQILKLYRPGLPDDLCRHEFAVTRCAHEVLHLAPGPIDIVSVDGRIGAVYERLSGKPLLGLMQSRPWRLRRYSEMLAGLHHSLHQRVDLDVQTVKQKLRQEIDAISLLSESEKRLVLERLAALPDGGVICHFDFHPGNIMVSGARTHVIDWMTACIGDPLSDVARTSLILKHAEVPRVPRLVSSVLRLFQAAIHRTYLREYLRLTGTSLVDIQAWELPLAAARLGEWLPERETRRLLALIRKGLQPDSGVSGRS